MISLKEWRLDMVFERANIDDLKHLIPKNLLFLGYRGSIAHNMYVPNTDPNSIDDMDLMGVFLGDVDNYIGLKNGKETIEKFEGQWDCVFYELKKVLGLLLKGNPNVLSLLWLDEKYVIWKTSAWEKIKSVRDAFASKYIYHSFVGYAHGQFDRMSRGKFEGYQGAKRKELVEKFGFDTKNASHGLRLLSMGLEFLKTGVLNVERTHDRDELLSIKRGEWSLERVQTRAKELFAECEEWKDKCSLPDEPDWERVNKVCKEIIGEYVSGHLPEK